jgi:signal transduction histidine kinase
VDGEEKERLRLAKELHDGLSPVLSSVRNNLEVIAPGMDNLDEKKRKYFDNSLSLLKNAMDEVRTMSKDLMPTSLQDYGFIIALKQLCERIDNTNGIKINFYSSDEKARYDSHVETGLYRIAQELINNAIKYSRADTINVHVVPHKKSVVLSIEDNGIGFVPAENKSKGFGLRNISSRVKSLNGFVSIDSRVKKGTLATIEIPV